MSGGDDGTPFNTILAQIWIDAPPSTSRAWNTTRTAPGDAYPPQLLAPLASRFEVPTEQDRWDTPLFRVAHQDALKSAEGALDAAHPGAGVSAHVGSAVFSAAAGQDDAPTSSSGSGLHADDSAAYATSSGVAPSGSTLDRVRIVAAGDGAGGGWSVVHVGSQVTHMTPAQEQPPTQGGAAPQAHAGSGDKLAALSSTGAKAFQLRPQHLLPGGSGPASASSCAPGSSGSAFRPKPAVRVKAAGTSAFKRKAAVKPHAALLAAQEDAAAAAAADTTTTGAAADDAGSVGGASSGAASGGGSSRGSVEGPETWAAAPPAGAGGGAGAADDASREAETADSAELQPQVLRDGWDESALRRIVTVGLQKDKLRASQATQKSHTQHSDLLFLLDSSTAKAARAICSALTGAALGSLLPAPPASVPVELSRRTTAAEVQRLRQQFMRLASGRVSSDELTRAGTEEANANLFVQFLNAALRRAV